MSISNVLPKVLAGLVCLFFILSCQKDFGNDANREQQFDYNQFSLELKWALTRSNIWQDYLDSSINDLPPSNSSPEIKLATKISLYEPIGEASALFQDKIIKTKNIDRKTFYLEHWHNITKSKQDSVKQILQNKETREIVLNQFRKMQKTNYKSKIASTIPDVDINSCRPPSFYSDQVANVLGATGRDFFMGMHGTVASYNGRSYNTSQYGSPIDEYNYLILLWQDNVSFRMIYSSENSCALYFFDIESAIQKILMEIYGLTDSGGGDGSGGGGGGGGGTDDGGGGSTSGTRDCAGVLNGGAYIGTCGKCIGGTTGITSCTELIDSLSNYPCAQDLLNQLPNLKNNIARLIKSQFAENDDFNITFRAKQLASDIDGLYNPNSNNMYNSTITLNTDILLNSSKEYILVTMYHEALHSYLNLEERRLSSTEFTVKYPNLSRIDNGQIPKYYFHHNGFPSFINHLADAIVSFNPDIPHSDAVVLSKTGIVTNMTNSELLINQSYRNGTKGKKCN